MESKIKEIILNCEKMERRFALLGGGKLEEYKLERDNDDPEPGDIFLGRLVNLDQSLQAAFVDIGAAKNAFLHFRDMIPGNSGLIEQFKMEKLERQNTSAAKKKKNKVSGEKSSQEISRRKARITAADIPDIFKPGMELLVQVTKGQIGTKGARVTTDISIPGRFLVLMPYCGHVGLSTRIESSTERERLRKIIAALNIPDGMGVICRTAGEGRRASFFKKDLELLLDYWDKISSGMEV